MRSASALASEGRLRFHDGQAKCRHSARAHSGGRGSGQSHGRSRGRGEAQRIPKKSQGRKRTWQPPTPQPGAQLLALLSSTDLLPLILCWLPLWSIVRCRRLCREALLRLDAQLGKIPQPVSVGGFSMREQGYSLGKFLAGAERFNWLRGQWVDAGALSTRRADHTVVSLEPELPSPTRSSATGGSSIAPVPTLLVLGGVNAPSKQAISWADFYRPVAQPQRHHSNLLPGPRSAIPTVLPLEHEQLRASSCVALRLGGTPTRVLVMGPAGGSACSSMGVRAFRVDMFLPAIGLGYGTVTQSGGGVWRKCANIPTPRLHFSAATVSMASEDRNLPIAADVVIGQACGAHITSACRSATGREDDKFDTLMIEKQYSGSGNTWPSNERVVVAGGLDAERKAVGFVEIYNPLEDCWYSRAECDTGVRVVGMNAAAAGEAVDEDMRVDEATIEGDDIDAHSSSDDEEEEPGVGIWKRTMVEPRWGACAVLTRCGRRIDILGGSDGNGMALNSTESFDVERRACCMCPLGSDEPFRSCLLVFGSA